MCDRNPAKSTYQSELFIKAIYLDALENKAVSITNFNEKLFFEVCIRAERHFE